MIDNTQPKMRTNEDKFFKHNIIYHRRLKYRGRMKEETRHKGISHFNSSMKGGREHNLS